METSEEESSSNKKQHKKRQRFLTGRQVAWMIYEYVKVSDEDESVLDFDEILKVELKNDNVQPFNARWDETIIAMKTQLDDEMLEKYQRQLQQSEQLKPMRSLNREKDGGPILGTERSISVVLRSSLLHDGSGAEEKSHHPREDSGTTPKKKATLPARRRRRRQRHPKGLWVVVLPPFASSWVVLLSSSSFGWCCSSRLSLWVVLSSLYPLGGGRRMGLLEKHARDRHYAG